MATEPTKPTRLKGRRKRFLRHLRATGSVTDAARLTGVSRDACYELRKVSPGFAEEWDEALRLGVDALEDEAKSRAFDRGDKASHLLLMFLLKGHRPERYREPKAESDALAVRDVLADAEARADDYQPARPPSPDEDGPATQPPGPLP